ncbi:hypothetical protein DFH29DRAFT_873472 [Suillus ampliporus]|nr:hypothetical protein DFH29DRAFT_873472 [Suillus ampliporus]
MSLNVTGGMVTVVTVVGEEDDVGGLESPSVRLQNTTHCGVLGSPCRSIHTASESVKAIPISANLRRPFSKTLMYRDVLSASLSRSEKSWSQSSNWEVTSSLPKRLDNLFAKHILDDWGETSSNNCFCLCVLFYPIFDGMELTGRSAHYLAGRSARVHEQECDTSKRAYTPQEWECGVFVWSSNEKMPRVSGTYGVEGDKIKKAIVNLKVKVNTPHPHPPHILHPHFALTQHMYAGHRFYPEGYQQHQYYDHNQ